VTTIESGAFLDNHLTSVIIPKTVTSLAPDAFDAGVTIIRHHIVAIRSPLTQA
jgi:hypothetical protein